MNKKIKILVIIMSITVLGTVVFFYRVEILAALGMKPEIVEEYVCSDVCREDDLKNIYKNVADESYCKKIGGKPYTYYGHGEFIVCLAE